jgi:hypothetical protein
MDSSVEPPEWYFEILSDSGGVIVLCWLCSIYHECRRFVFEQMDRWAPFEQLQQSYIVGGLTINHDLNDWIFVDPETQMINFETFIAMLDISSSYVSAKTQSAYCKRCAYCAHLKSESLMACVILGACAKTTTELSRIPAEILDEIYGYVRSHVD